VRQDQKEKKVQWDQQMARMEEAKLDPQAKLVNQVTKVRQERRDQQDRKDPLAHLVRTAAALIVHRLVCHLVSKFKQ
jgi:hypothetical protein